MTEYKVWAFARSAAPNLPALEDQLADVMREADRRVHHRKFLHGAKYGTEFGGPPCLPCSPPCSKAVSTPSWCRALTG